MMSSLFPFAQHKIANISKREKRYSKEENAILLYFEKPFNVLKLFCSEHMTEKG